MGKAWRPELTTANQVISYYEENPFIHYKVFAGTDPISTALRYEYDGTEKSEGSEELRKACQSILSNPQNINTYLLQIIKSDKKIKLDQRKNGKTVEDAVNITFQLNFAQNMFPVVGNNTMGGMDQQNPNAALLDLMKQMAETQNLILSKFAAIEENPIEEEEENSIGSIISGLLKDDQIKGLLINSVMGLFGQKKQIQMSGIKNDEEDTRINQAIAILKEHDPEISTHLLKLAAIAQQNMELFIMLLNQLDSMVQLES